jgi:hypothetical protein
MEKSELILQRNLNGIFSFAKANHRAPSAYWSKLFASRQFAYFLAGQPFDLSLVHAQILAASKSLLLPSDEALLYLSHLVIYFRSATTFSSPKIGRIIDPKEVTASFMSLHVQDDRNVLADFCLQKASQLSLTGVQAKQAQTAFLAADSLARLALCQRALERIFAYPWLQQGIARFDERLACSYREYPGGHYLFAFNPESLTSEQETYWQNRFQSAGETFLFVDALLKGKSAYPSYFFCDEKAIRFLSFAQPRFTLSWRLFR